ncbi:discoidin domain-containing protein [Tenacibaculum maritimum]|uniref:galactose-binding domain-containing protein n=1 Tax=Tenacibaculum maritimum TaxID=107401 RepID=UPI003875B393
MMNKILFFLLLAASNIYAQTSNFFVHAHQDDAVYFSGVKMFNTLRNLEKTTFIVISASDQGAHDGPLSGWYDTKEYPNPFPFYEARDNGLKKAIQYCVTDKALPKKYSAETTTVTINGKKVRKWEYGTTVTAYFLDLPNGQCCNFGMGGYPANSNENLEQLLKGQIPSITNVTGTTTYNGWNEVIATINGIFRAERGRENKVYTTDVDLKVNPDDHTDHYMSGVLALEAMKDIDGFSPFLHVDYNLTALTPNLSPIDIVYKSSTFGAMINGIADRGYNSNRHFSFLHWFTAEYIRQSSATKELSNLDPLLKGPNSPDGNIAFRKPSRASHIENGRASSQANDGRKDLNNYWAASSYPQSWQVDLGDLYEVNKIILTTYYDGKRYYQYDIEGSIDGVNWKKIVDYSKNTRIATEAGDTFDISNEEARYLKVNMKHNTANTSVHIIEFEAYGDIVSEDYGDNIALNKPSRASDVENGRASSLANDGRKDLNNYWAAASYPEWWQVDLGGLYDVNRIIVTTYYDQNRYYQYDIESSLDGVNWKSIVDFSRNTNLATSAGNIFSIGNERARYLRVNMKHNTANTSVHIIEFEAYGTEVTVSKSLRSDRIFEENTLKLYANPSENGFFDIDLSSAIGEAVNFVIADINGNQVTYGSFDVNHGNIERIDLSAYEDGMYILNIKIGAGRELKNEKLILKRK